MSLIGHNTEPVTSTSHPHKFICILTLYSPVVAICTTRFNSQQFHVLRTQCIYVFCVDLRTNSDYFPTQH